MNILHIIPCSDNLLYPFLKMLLLSRSNTTKHTFLVTASKEMVIQRAPLLLACKDLIFLPEINFSAKDSYSYFDKADKIIWHSFWGTNLFCIRWLIRNKALFTKSMWIIWDEEIRAFQNYKNNIVKPDSHFTDIGYIYNHFCTIAFQSELSLIIFNDIFPLMPNQQTAILPYPLSYKVRNILKEFSIKQQVKFHTAHIFQIGYSSLAINRHAELLSRLAAMQLNCNYMFPINFNDNSSEYQNNKQYISYIKKIAGTFSDLHITFLSKTLSCEQYLKFLCQLDGVILFDYYATCSKLLLYCLQTCTPIFFAQESKYYLFLKQKNFPAYLLEDISSFLDNKSIKEYGLNSNSFCSCIDYIVSIQDVWKNLSVLF